MKTAHTPAPWQVFYMPASSDKEGEHHFALVADKCKDTLAENYSNACLMAAAPDLLVALQELNRAVRQFTNADESDWPELVAAHAAIAKAGGAA